MKRAAALTSLSRDHHQALAVAQKLRRATPDTSEHARRAFIEFWANGHGHFRIEEDVLLPAYAAHGDSHHPLVARVLCDHVAIRSRARALDRPPPATLVALHELGEALANHVRLEERELFPLIESTLPADALRELALAIDEAERAAAHG
jgi:hemerythrin-like domain-containing protein